jgi:hypothetical protein
VNTIQNFLILKLVVSKVTARLQKANEGGGLCGVYDIHNEGLSGLCGFTLGAMVMTGKA